MEFFLPDYVISCINTIESSGYEAWVVGGCVRDLLLEKKPVDYDIASSAPVLQIPTLFKKVFLTGVKHGTVTVLVKGQPLEVTQFRIDGEYFNRRHPSGFTFTNNLNEDLSRRDFTVNALAYHPKRGIIDPFNGQADIKHRIIRAVGDPDARFNEDALRIMRAFRFACQLNFEFDEQTKQKALLLSPLLKEISAERIFSELSKAIESDNPHLLEPLISCGGLEFCGLRFSKPLSPLKYVPNNRELRFAALCDLCGGDAEIICDHLKTDRKLKINAQKIIKLLNNPLPADLLEIKRSFSFLEPEFFKLMLNAREALFHEDITHALACLETVLSENQPWKISHLAIDGTVLKEIGITGKKAGEVLNDLLLSVSKNPALNEKENLIFMAKNIKTK